MRRALFLLLAAIGGSAHAGYAQMVPPAGASTGTGGQLMYRAAANQSWLQSTVRTNAALNVGGRTVQVPVAMRMAANAPRFLARAAFVHPALLAGAIAAPFVIDWAQDHGFFLQNQPPGMPKIWMQQTTGLECSPTGNQMATDPNGWCKSAYGGSYTGTSSTVPTGPTQCRVDLTCTHSLGSTVGHSSFVPRVESTSPPQVATALGFENSVGTEQKAPMPQQAPDELGVPVPVDAPVINPSPGLNPIHQPLMIPLGDPVPVPNSNPQRWEQPVARVVPSPTASDPWRVDVREEKVVSETPDPINDPDPTPDSPDPSKQEDTATDSPLPPVPDFYTQKYPDGFDGVWQQRKGEIAGSGLMTFAAKLMPTTLGNGTCPQFQMSLDIGLKDFGTVNVSPPCYVWDFGKVIVIISALLLARRLVFGG